MIHPGPQLYLWLAWLILSAAAEPPGDGAEWLNQHQPFIVSGDAQKFVYEVVAPHTDTSVLARILGQASEEYQHKLQEYSTRMRESGVTSQQQYYVLLGDWEADLQFLADAYDDRVLLALDDHMKQWWAVWRDRHRYRQTVANINRSIIDDRIRLTDAFELLDEAGVAATDDQIFDVVLEQVQSLAALASSYRAEWPKVRMLEHQQRPGGDEAKRVKAWVDSAVSRLRAATYDALRKISFRLDGTTRQVLESRMACRKRPEACTTTPMNLAFELLRQCVAIRPDVRLQIVEIETSYGAQLDALRTRFIDAQEQWDAAANAARRDREFEALRASGQDPHMAWRKHPGLATLKRLYALEAGTAQRVIAAFPVEEWKSLPARVRLALTWPSVQEP